MKRKLTLFAILSIIGIIAVLINSAVAGKSVYTFSDFKYVAVGGLSFGALLLMAFLPLFKKRKVTVQVQNTYKQNTFRS